MLSTSVRHGGQVDHVRLPARIIRAAKAPPITIGIASSTEAGLEAYHDRVCARGGAAAGRDGGDGHGREHELRRRRDAKPTRTSTVTAAVTAGVEGNATAAGDPATWRETDDRHAEGAGLRRHHQHDAAHQPAADAGGAGAGGRDDDRRQERRAAAAGGAEQAARRPGHRHRHRSVLHRRALVRRARRSPRRART